MMSFLRYALWLVAAVILSLRCRVHITGLDKVRGATHALILPNHPGYIDPPLVLRTLWPVLKPRPMLLDSTFHNPVIFWLPRLMDAVEIPELRQASVSARKQTERSLQVIVEGLKAGRNHILWPSGRVYRNVGRESLGASRSISEILQAAPNAKVILVRTRGVWGSMFSYARTGRQPNLVAALLKGAGVLLCNLLFFTPRRHIHITLELLDRSQLPGLAREQINPFVEAWYNAPGDEEPLHVPYHFLFGPRSYDFPKPDIAAGTDLEGIRPETRETIAHMVADVLKRDPEPTEYDPANKLETLGLDSIERMELSLEVERRFGFKSEEAPETIGGLWAMAEGLVVKGALKPVPRAWFVLPDKATPLTILDTTMASAFVKRCLAAPECPAAVDDFSGMVNYERLLISATLLSRRFAQLPGRSVGVLLPAGVASLSTYFALHLAGKLPVLLNWTTGPGNLAHAAQVMQLEHVITSRAFIDRSGVSVAGTKYLMLEDLRSQIGKAEMLKTLLRIRYAPGTVLRRLPSQSPDDPAVVLFTSGSEKAPKAVPLTHKNILSDLLSALEAFKLTTHDSLMGFLPSFHSFGLTVTTILPAITGARVVYHPDPTDSATIARKSGQYKTTVTLGTPTFISLIMNRGEKSDLQALRLIVVGAEKCPAALFEKAKQMAPQASVIEGYGITECAPVVAANRVEHNKPGSVGPPLSVVKVKIVDIETHQRELPTGEVGMLLIHGPNVFPGYIGEGGDPFIELDGLRWYISGDLARLDEDGFIWLAGRLKRFIKAGGEMISLPAIEEPIAKAYPPDDQGPRVAVEGVETGDGRRIVLFATFAFNLREANELLRAAGLRGIMRIDEVRTLQRIPVLGTGKTDYKVLKAMIA